jgi:hypothetical protein
MDSICRRGLLAGASLAAEATDTDDLHIDSSFSVGARSSIKSRFVCGLGALAILTLAVMIGSPQIALADSPGCADGNACAWNDYNYNGSRRDIDGSQGGTGWHNFQHRKYSAKNRFDTRCILLSSFIGGGGPGVVSLNPGENDPTAPGAGGWWAFKVTDSGVFCA